MRLRLEMSSGWGARNSRGAALGWLLAALLGTLFSPLGAAAEGEPAPADGPFRVPYRLTDAKHLLVRARLNDKGPFYFLIDTGAPALFLRPEAARKAGIQPNTSGWGKVDRLEIEGGARLEGVRARVEEPPQIKGMNALGIAGVSLDGLLGYEVLAHFKIEIDLTRSSMVWSRSSVPPLPLPNATDLKGVKPDAVDQSQSALEGLARMVGALAPKLAPLPPVQRGYVGIELAEEPSTSVKGSVPGSPASRAGLRPGDRITGVAIGDGPNQPVHTILEIHRALSRLEPGQKLRLTIQRGKLTLQRIVTAGKESL